MTQRDPSNGDQPARVDMTALREGLVGLSAAVGRVAVLMKRTAVGQVVIAALLVLSAGGLFAHACWMAGRLGTVTSQLDESARMLEQVRAQGEKTERKVEDVKADVAEVQATQPTIELRASDAGAGRPQAAIVVRPKPARPLASSSAGAPPPPPAVTIPVQLPPGSKAVVEDAGTH